MTRFLLAASAASLLGIVPALAQTTGTHTAQTAATQTTQGTATQTTQGTEQVSAQDRTFVQVAAQGNEAEIQAAHLAETRGATPAVREFGRWMVTDHTMMNEMLHAIAQRAGVEVPTSPSHQQMQQMSELKTLQGARFDQTYVDAQVRDHEAAISAFKQEANDGQNEMLRRLAAHGLPMIEQHLTEARELQQASGTSSVASTQPR